MSQNEWTGAQLIDFTADGFPLPSEGGHSSDRVDILRKRIREDVVKKYLKTRDNESVSIFFD